ncbi:unnamed protein product [Camellia sinensis]
MLLLQIFQRFPAEFFFAAVCFISNTVPRRNFPKRWSAVCLFPKAPPCQILLLILGYSRGIQISHADNEEENKCHPFEQQGILFFMHMGFLTRYIYIYTYLVDGIAVMRRRISFSSNSWAYFVNNRGLYIYRYIRIKPICSFLHF